MKMEEKLAVKKPSLLKRFVKRSFDLVSSGLAIVILLPFFLLFTPLVAIAMKGNPFFVQKRPGKDGKIFKMIKYRTMTNAKDADGKLLPDDQRLTGFGKLMRKLSIDELPEIFNIFLGQMSVVGPRPQLVRDLVFFDQNAIKRQSIKPGLTGWAQVNGRNNITWEQKFALDLEYLQKQSLWLDIKILFMTVFKVFARRDINTEGMETAEDLGDYLLRTGQITQAYYDKMMSYAKVLLPRSHYSADILACVQQTNIVEDIDYSKYSVLMTVYKNTDLGCLQQSLDSMRNQTIAPDQIIIVFDGPVKEEVSEFLNKCQQELPKCLEIYKLDENQGLGSALKEGTKYCRNQLIARMDDDDISCPDRIEKQLNYMKAHPEIDVLGGNIEEFIDQPQNIVGKRVVPESHADILRYQKSRCPFNHVSVMLKKCKVEMAGGYRHWHFNEDSYLWARMTLAGCRFGNLPDTLVCVRVGKAMYQRRGGYAYYKSERDFFRFMRREGLIGWCAYQKAKIIRFVVQVLMPNRVRQWFFKTFARS